MKVILTFSSFILWMLFCSVLPAPEQKGVFGIKINMQATGQLYFIEAFMSNGRTLTKGKILSKDEFIKFASGYWPSIYNPERINYFIQNQLSCGVATDTSSNQKFSYCIPLDSLWKIRYANYPFTSTSEKGWSSHMITPSERQANFLYNRYGIKNLDNSFFIDDKLWLLLRDIQDQSWINSYKSMK